MTNTAHVTDNTSPSDVDCLATLINDIQADLGAIHTGFPKMVPFDSFDLTHFTKQESGYHEVEYEYVVQHGDDEHGYYGTLAIPFGTYLIVFDFNG
ncbi:hypothetical protein [Neptuniibacter sp. QD37_11]|uniref:hypothetical protein n=1 Tax=Neptuniibacter sp. QD37_11 TaxID=3398209 RepID=UPI0039F4585C